MVGTKALLRVDLMDTERIYNERDTKYKISNNLEKTDKFGHRPYHGVHDAASTAGRVGARQRRCDSAGACDSAANDAGQSWPPRARGPGSDTAAAAASRGANGRTWPHARARTHIRARRSHLA